jgi:hypothetical protein
MQISKTFAEFKTLFFNEGFMCQCADEAMCQFKTQSIINPTVIASKGN